MNTTNKISIALLGSWFLLCALPSASAVEPKSAAQALVSGKASIDLRLRYESVSQANALLDADALTLRSRLAYTTADYQGWSATLEMEDSRPLFGVDDFSVPATGFNPGEFSVIADPETTELDQGFFQYQRGGFTGKVGRQVIVLENHRHVGHVGWRQDRQTFDALVLAYKWGKQADLKLMHLTKRNRIFAEDLDIDARDNLVHLNYDTPLGKVSAFAYFLEEDDANRDLDTVGISLQSKPNKERNFSYRLEVANQDNGSLDTDYMQAEFGTKVAKLGLALGVEVLGSDEGDGAFATPLATLHKFNGWSDQFLRTPDAGLEDVYFKLSGKLWKGKWLAVYHDFSSDVAMAGGSDLGNELNISYSRPFGKHIYSGIKLADYSAGDAQFGKVDTDKLWIWAGVKF